MIVRALLISSAMVKVTNHNYYLDDSLKTILDLMIRRAKKKWDNLLIIDGKERAGKSTLAKSIGYYYAHHHKQEFGLNNIFFDPEDMMAYALKTKRQVLIWDEAAFGGLSSQWQSKIQQKLNQMLMVAGKYEHFYIFIIPSFFKLNWYMAVHRSELLIHVYSADMESRGDFTYFNPQQKCWIYNNNKKSNMYTSPSGRGKFTYKNTDKILDETAYEAKKDDAIMAWAAKDSDKPGSKETQYQLLKYLASKLIDTQILTENLEKTERTVQKWRNITKKYTLLAKYEGIVSSCIGERGEEREDETST